MHCRWYRFEQQMLPVSSPVSRRPEGVGRSPRGGEPPCQWLMTATSSRLSVLGGGQEGEKDSLGEILWSRTDDYLFLFNLKRMALWRGIKKRPRALDPNAVSYTHLPSTLTLNVRLLRYGRRKCTLDWGLREWASAFVLGLAQYESRPGATEHLLTLDTVLIEDQLHHAMLEVIRKFASSGWTILVASFPSIPDVKMAASRAAETSNTAILTIALD